MVESNSMHVLGAPIAFKASPGPARLTLQIFGALGGSRTHTVEILSLPPPDHLGYEGIFYQDQLFAVRGFTICLHPHQRYTEFVL